MRIPLPHLLALALTGSGCWITAGEYDVHRTAQDRRLRALETNDQQVRTQLRETLTQATAQVRTLTEQLEQARTQTRNLADLGARLDSIEERLRTQNGSVDELRHAAEMTASEAAQARTQLTQRIDTLERRVGIAPLVDPAQIPNEPARALDLARQAFDAHDYPRARFVSGVVLQRAPQDPLADDALLLVARSYVAENRPATAVQELQRLLQAYPNGDAMPTALATLAEAFVNLRMCTEAQRTLRLLIERHGRTPAGTAARTRLDAVRHLPREACGG